MHTMHMDMYVYSTYMTLHVHVRACVYYKIIIYSGTLLNGHPSIADTCDNIMDNSECPDRISIDFNIFKPPQ